MAKKANEKTVEKKVLKAGGKASANDVKKVCCCAKAGDLTAGSGCGSGLGGGTFLKHKPCGMTLREMYSRPLTYGKEPSGLCYSPDGEYVAFLWNEKGEAVRDLYVCRVGEKPRRLTDAAAIGALPVEDDERPAEEVCYAEKMYGGISEFCWVRESMNLVFVCRGNLFICDLNGLCERLTLCNQGQGNISCARVGAGLFFVKGGNLFRYDLDYGTFRQLTFLQKAGVGVCDYRVSPSGDRVAVLVENTSGWEDIRMPDYTPAGEVKINMLRRNNVGKKLATYRLGMVTVPRAGEGAGLIEWVGLPGFSEDEKRAGVEIMPQGACWALDGKSFFFSFTLKDFRNFRLGEVVFSGTGFSVVQRFEDYLEPWVEWSKLECDKKGTVHFLSYRDGWLQLYALDRGGSVLRRETCGGFDIMDFTVTPAGKVFYTALCPDPQKCKAYVLGASGKGRAVVDSMRCWENLVVSEDGSAWSVIASSIMEPPVLIMGAGKKFGRVLDCGKALAKVRRAQVRQFSFVNKEDGAKICGTLTLPWDFDPGKKYPAVLRCVYAGQGKMGFGRYNLLDNYMANEMGYVLVGIDLRASHGYGHKFAQGYYKSLGIVDCGELVSCAEYLRGLEWIDGSRIGIWGGSYGGFLTLMAMCNHPGVFHTGISWKPVTDWKNYWDCYTAPRLGRPDEDPEIYVKTSPVFHAAGLEGNLLLVHGMQDDNVLFQDAAWMIQKLIENEKYFDLMVYPRDNHGLDLRYESLPDCMERIAAYFEEHMGLGPR